MLSAIRKNQHSLTLLTVLLTIVSFIWLYNRTNLSQVGVNDVASIYGRVLQRADIERGARHYRLAMALGLTQLVRDMGGFAENEEVAISSFIFNILVLQHEAQALEILPTEKEIAAAIEKLPLFQTEGVFDPAKYSHMMQEELATRGLTERQLEEVVRDALSLAKVRDVVVSPVAISEAQLREAARAYQSFKAQALFFNTAPYLNSKKEVTEEEKKSFYEKNANFFKTDETRSARYTVVTLLPEQQKLGNKERVRMMQQLSDRLVALKQKVQKGSGEKNFEKVAAEQGLKVVTTRPFNKQGEELSAAVSLSKKEKNISSKLPQELVDAAFRLSKVGDTSEIIQSGSSFYLLTLTQATPSQTLAFSQVEKNVEQLLLEQKAIQTRNEAAAKALQKIRDALAAGKNFSEAVALASCKTELLPSTVSPEKAALSTQLSLQQKAAIAATLPLQNGELSELKQAPWGAFAVYLETRTPLSHQDWEEHRGQIEENFLQQEQELLFFEWIKKARNEAQITMLDGRHRRSLLQTIFGK